MNNYDMRYKFQSFEQIREAGITNMFDLKTVKALTGLTEEEVFYIYLHYDELKSIEDAVQAFKKQLEDEGKAQKQAEESDKIEKEKAELNKLFGGLIGDLIEKEYEQDRDLIKSILEKLVVIKL